MSEGEDSSEVYTSIDFTELRVWGKGEVPLP